MLQGNYRTYGHGCKEVIVTSQGISEDLRWSDHMFGTGLDGFPGAPVESSYVDETALPGTVHRQTWANRSRRDSVLGRRSSHLVHNPGFPSIGGNRSAQCRAYATITQSTVRQVAELDSNSSGCLHRGRFGVPDDAT